jgi:hypothetical protein
MSLDFEHICQKVLEGLNCHQKDFAGICKGNLTDLRRILHLSLAKGNPK